MTRREFLGAAMVAAAAPASGELVVPVRLIFDGQVKWWTERLHWFDSVLWFEAVRDLGRCGVRLEAQAGPGEVLRPPGREPIVSGLDRAAINVVVTGRIPLTWDGGRGLGGVTTQYRGHHLCMIALELAHGHRIPFVAVNTCLHELLHVFLLDIFERRPPGVDGQAREARIDYHATRLWMLRSDDVVRRGAETYAQRARGYGLLAEDALQDAEG